MEETRNTKDRNGIGYRLEDGIYYQVDFGKDKIIEDMQEVAFLFGFQSSWSTAEEVGSGPELLRHGLPFRVNAYAKHKKQVWSENGLNSIFPIKLIVIQGKFPIEEIDKMLSISGYMMKVKE